MNYEKIYNDLMTSRKSMNRKKGCGTYYESHHIIPASIGGTSDKENLILLTFKEHFIAHLLLVYMYTGKNRIKMANALHRMSFDRKNENKILSSSQYSMVKTIYRNSEPQKGERNSMYGKSLYSIWLEKYGKEEADKKLIEYKKKTTKTGEKNSFYGKTHSKETKEKLSIKKKGTITTKYIVINKEENCKFELYGANAFIEFAKQNNMKNLFKLVHNKNHPKWEIVIEKL